MSKRAKEKALKAYDEEWPESLRLAFQEGYEQSEKDTIERACKWLEQALTHGCHPCSGSRFVIEFRKAMEE